MGTGKKLRFAMMSGALKNAGDFLIVKRSRELLEYVYPGAEFFYFSRSASMEPHLEELNQMDAMVFCGGPAYLPHLYPEAFPLVEDLGRIQTPMFALGLGWFGSSIANKAVYHYPFSETTLQLLKRIEADTEILGCRDWYSVNVLRSNGIYSGKMTGCPAWYNLAFAKETAFHSANPYDVKKICISDPANAASMEYLVDLAAYVSLIFPKAERTVVFHRGMEADGYTGQHTAQRIRWAVEECAKAGVQCVDISYGEEGVSVYDNCDLHLGFRVHAHIYNLSRRNISVLIEEDARGAGVNGALGLSHIAAYDFGIKAAQEGERIVTTLGTVPNKYLMQMVDDYLNNLYQSDFLQIKNAYRMMQEYFSMMVKHVESLGSFL